MFAEDSLCHFNGGFFPLILPLRFDAFALGPPEIRAIYPQSRSCPGQDHFVSAAGLFCSLSGATRPRQKPVVESLLCAAPGHNRVGVLNLFD